MLDRPHPSRSAAVTTLVASVVAKYPGSADLAPETELARLGLNSIDMVELMLAVEDRFDVTIPPGDITVENFRSVSAILRLVDRLCP